MTQEQEAELLNNQVKSLLVLNNMQERMINITQDINDLTERIYALEKKAGIEK